MLCDPTNGACCTDQCQYASQGTVCRPALNDICDTAETCTGTNSTCPTDITAEDGKNCGNGLTCASGHCTSLDRQCQISGSSLNLTNACGAKNDKTCVVSCKDPTTANTCQILQTVLIDGSECGYGGRCYNGTCKSGKWTEVFDAMYTQNLQISIPVTIAVGLVVS
jgi:hypothetical protein